MMRRYLKMCACKEILRGEGDFLGRMIEEREKEERVFRSLVLYAKKGLRFPFIALHILANQNQ